jgi:hypothetical protein
MRGRRRIRDQRTARRSFSTPFAVKFNAILLRPAARHQDLGGRNERPVGALLAMPPTTGRTPARGVRVPLRLFGALRDARAVALAERASVPRPAARQLDRARKGPSRTRLPNYLRQDRPRCDGRKRLVGARAPHLALSHPAVISCLVRRALKRAGVDPSRKGPIAFATVWPRPCRAGEPPSRIWVDCFAIGPWRKSNGRTCPPGTTYLLSALRAYFISLWSKDTE